MKQEDHTYHLNALQVPKPKFTSPNINKYKIFVTRSKFALNLGPYFCFYGKLWHQFLTDFDKISFKSKNISYVIYKCG